MTAQKEDLLAWVGEDTARPNEHAREHRAPKGEIRRRLAWLLLGFPNRGHAVPNQHPHM